MNKLNSIVPALIVAPLLFLGSCQNGSGDKSAGSKDTTGIVAAKPDSAVMQKKSEIEFKFATAEANLPAPFEVVRDITGYHADYKPDLLNASTNADNYVSAFKKEVNMGIYGIDLAYVNFYGQNQELLHYFVTIQKLARDLSFDKVFDDYSDRFKNNSGNKDSIVRIIDNVWQVRSLKSIT